MELTYSPKVTDNGKLPKEISDQIKELFLSFKGKNITITITDEVNRTDKQNRLWWLYVEVIRKHTGNSATEMHELLKSMFIPFATSTTELTTVQFSDALNEVIKWSAEYLNVILPYESETPEA